MSKVKERLDYIRHTQILKDPFPDPEGISIWKAYQQGYDKAYKEIQGYFEKFYESKVSKEINPLSPS